MHPFGETDSLQRSVGTPHGQKLGLFRPLCATPRGKPFESLQTHMLPIAALVAVDKCVPSARLTVSKGRLVRYMVRSWAFWVRCARRHGASHSNCSNHTLYSLLHWLRLTIAAFRRD